MKILLVGYFDRGNFGDDLFKYIWSIFFQHTKHEIVYSSIDDIKLLDDISIFDKIILGGGDVINEYFIDILYTYIGSKGIKITAVSVGIPFNDILLDDRLLMFDAIVCRTKIDTMNLKQRFGDVIDISYFPDISVLLSLPDEEEEDTTTNNVGVCLSRTIIKTMTRREYDDFVEMIARRLDNIVCDKIYMIPFCVFDNDNENDIIIHKDVHRMMKTNRDKTMGFERRFSVSEMNDMFRKLNLTVVMRYHAHMLSFIHNVPMISFGKTRKVDNFLKEGVMRKSMDDLVSILNMHKKKTSSSSPKIFTKNRIMSEIACCTSATTIAEKICFHVTGEYRPEFFYGLYKKLSTSTKYKIQKELNWIVSEHYENTDTIYFTVLSVVEFMIKSRDIMGITESIMRGEINFYHLAKERNVNIDNMKHDIASLACYKLLGETFPKYHFGMSEKIFTVDFDVVKEFKWVLLDYSKHRSVDIESSGSCGGSGLFDMAQVGTTDFKGVHRSGWQYVIDNVFRKYHDKNNALLFDNYVDRTFMWGKTVYKHIEVIPYKRKWCGFVHHTFDETFSDYNLVEMFRTSEFRISLKYCVALFVMSEYLMKKLKLKLSDIGCSHVNVYVLTHPTETDVKKWTEQNFNSNEERRIINIGGWLRNSYSIYRLMMGDNSDIKKTVLKGSNMDNYFPLRDSKMKIVSDNVMTEYDFSFKQMNSMRMGNKFFDFMTKMIANQYESVEVIESVSNDEYDVLLSKNIVFLDLVDASAVNTIIECIVRNTPVLVNKHPAVVELLGDTYPLYYQDLAEASMKIRNKTNIMNAHSYIATQINKKKFTLKYFDETFSNIIHNIISSI